MKRRIISMICSLTFLSALSISAYSDPFSFDREFHPKAVSTSSSDDSISEYPEESETMDSIYIDLQVNGDGYYSLVGETTINYGQDGDDALESIRNILEILSNSGPLTQAST